MSCWTVQEVASWVSDLMKAIAKIIHLCLQNYMHYLTGHHLNPTHSHNNKVQKNMQQTTHYFPCVVAICTSLKHHFNVEDFHYARLGPQMNAVGTTYWPTLPRGMEKSSNMKQ